METRLTWNEGMSFDAQLAEPHVVRFDAVPPIGKGSGPSPKQMMLASICGCTAMDVAALLKKHRQPVKTFSLHAQADLTETHPKVFKVIHLTYELTGDIKAERIKEAVALSLSQYCGVSAMVAKVSPIDYIIKLNGVEVARGEDQFWKSQFEGQGS